MPGPVPEVPPPLPNPLRWPQSFPFELPSAKGPKTDGSFDYLPLASRLFASGGGGGNANATTAEIMGNGRTLIVTFEMPNPAAFGVPDWLPGKLAGRTCSLSSGARLSFRSATCGSNVPTFGSGTFTASTLTLTKVGAFANYRSWVSGDIIAVIGATGSGVVTDKGFSIASRVSDDAITLTTSFGGDATAVSGLTMPPGQGTKLTWRVEFLIVTAAQVVTYDTTGLRFTADTGLLQDGFGNSSASVSIPVTNNSLVDADGFTTKAGFTRGTGGATLYVCPAPFGNDSNTFAQAQSMATPVATLGRASSLAFSNSQNGAGCRITLLEGTSQATAIQIRWSGAARLQPALLDSYWDSGLSGQGTQGVRPVINSGGVAVTVTGGAGSPIDVSLLVIRRLELVGTLTANCANMFRSFGTGGYGFVFDDCLLRNGPVGISMQSDLNGGFVMQDRCLINRCIFSNCFSGSAGHTSAMYSFGASNLVVSQTHCDMTGREGDNGALTGIFSRSMYHDSESEPVIVWGPYISRSDGIQVRPGGSITDAVFTQAQLSGFVDISGRFARSYSEFGADFGGTAFTNATYTHSTRTLALTGIGTSMSPPVTIWAQSGTGVVTGQYRVASVPDANSLVLTGAGLGAGADGATNVTGAKQNAPRGFGPQPNSGSDMYGSNVLIVELNLGAYLNVYGSAPEAVECPGRDTRYARQLQQIIRNNTFRQCGPNLIDGSDSLLPPRIMTRAQNLIDNRGTTLRSESDGSFTSWDFLHSDNNVFLSDAAASLFVNSSSKTLAQYQALTGQEANSLSSGTPTYVNDGADLSAWAVASGAGTTEADLRNAILTRAAGAWPTAVDMSLCVAFMFGQYAVSGLPAVGAAPLNFYGCGTSDPATYG